MIYAKRLDCSVYRWSDKAAGLDERGRKPTVGAENCQFEIGIEIEIRFSVFAAIRGCAVVRKNGRLWSRAQRPEPRDCGLVREVPA